ncbi:MFS transporter [Actinoplanes sp. NPDC049265]|uniref:MFS transporter n=1 Tax=Actinoplanes sp. NPDC049265 TaxID=3363902 RepID=UPI0037228BBE
MTPWRAIAGFGVVSLTADMVYEGARSITGPLLAALGASALAVGLVTGAGEAAALLLRLVSGPLADRTSRYWTLTILGYALTAACVPLLAVTPALGAAGLTVAATLIIAERVGKAIRSPAKSALLAQAAVQVGQGRGFAVHKALDQVGAFAGPLAIAAVVAATGVLWPALAALSLPGAVTLGLLLYLRPRFPAPAPPAATPSTPPSPSPSTASIPTSSSPPPPAASIPAASSPASPPPAAFAPASSLPAPAAPSSAMSAAGSVAPSASPAASSRWARWIGAGLPARFYWFAGSAAAATAGLLTFGLMSFHAVEAGLVPVAAAPLLYAGAMAAGAIAALATGWLYDRWGARVLFALPVIGGAAPALSLSHSVTAIVVGGLLWGAAGGVLDSTVKALVADLVAAPRRATAYGVFAAIQGAAALAGGALAGALYAPAPLLLVVLLIAAQLAGAALLAIAIRRPPPETQAPVGG